MRDKKEKETEKNPHLAVIFRNFSLMSGLCLYRSSEREIKARRKGWPSVCWLGRHRGSLKLSLNPLCHWVWCRCCHNQWTWTKTNIIACFREKKNPLVHHCRSLAYLVHQHILLKMTASPEHTICFKMDVLPFSQVLCFQELQKKKKKLRVEFPSFINDLVRNDLSFSQSTANDWISINRLSNKIITFNYF